MTRLIFLCAWIMALATLWGCQTICDEAGCGDFDTASATSDTDSNSDVDDTTTGTETDADASIETDSSTH